jgi:hypothetical protein
MFLTPDPVHEPLHLVVPIMNQKRFKTRWKLARRFFDYAAKSGAILTIVEVAYGERKHALADVIGTVGVDRGAVLPAGAGHQYIALRSKDELWLKESILNAGVQRLPADWKYVAFVDADVQFARPNWVGETIHKLQHHPVVQMFSEALDLGPKFTKARGAELQRSFVDCYRLGLPTRKEQLATKATYYGGATGIWHPGYAWAWRRDAFDAVGGLIDIAICGAADWHMANALIGNVDDTLSPGMSEDFVKAMHEWQLRAETHIRRNVGCVDTLLMHYWHGRKSDRGYTTRGAILTEQPEPYSQLLDLKRDWQGLWQLVDRGDLRSIRLRDRLMAYFVSRDEDGTTE